MTLTFLLSLIPLAASTWLAIETGGGTVGEILDLIPFAGVMILFAVAIFISGYGKDFCRIFSTKKKFSEMDFQKLQQTDIALDFASRILFYTALLIPVLVLIYTLSNYYNDAKTYSHLGPNCAVLILSILYLSLFEMIILTLKARTRKSVVLYMAESEKLTVKKTNTARHSLKVTLGIILFIITCGLYGYVSGIYAWGKYPLLGTIIDVPFILIMLIYVLPLIALSGNFMILCGAIKTVFTGRAVNITQKNLYLNIVKTTVQLNWYAAFSGAACGWIGILCNLEDSSSLPANLAVSLIPFFYATCLNLFLLLVEIRVNKAAD